MQRKYVFLIRKYMMCGTRQYDFLKVQHTCSVCIFYCDSPADQDDVILSFLRANNAQHLFISLLICTFDRISINIIKELLHGLLLPFLSDELL